MPNPTYIVFINSPCSGRALVDQHDAITYTGTSPSNDVSGVILKLVNNEQWIIAVSPTDSASGCFPSRTFNQDTPNADDPTGSYDNGDATVQ